jgi:hypothetical protein
MSFIKVDPTKLIEKLEAEVRAQRNALLTSSDWIVSASYERGEPVPEAWASYRQALRGVPQQPGFPQSVDWPVPPE